MAELIDAGVGFATAGEERAIQTLRALPNDWLVVANKVLAVRSGKSYETDLIVVGHHRITLLDEKSFRGRILGSDQIWTLNGSQSLQSPLNKADFVAKILAGWLRDRVPGFPTGEPHPVAGGVILSAEDVQAQIHDPRARDGLLRLDNAVERLIDLDRAAAKQGLDLRPFRAAIRDALYKIPDRPRVLREIGHYAIDDEVERVAGCRVYQARHRDGGRRLLYVYDPPSPNAPDREAIAREVTALRALQATGVVPQVGDTFTWADDHEVVPVHLPTAVALGALPRPDGVATALREIERAAAAFFALARVHAARIVHRRINPATVAIHDPSPPAEGATEASPPRAVLTGFVAARIEGSETIAPALDAGRLDDPYAAPEIVRIGSYGFAEAASDVYSLALVTVERLAGTPLQSLFGPAGAAGPPTADAGWPYLAEGTVDALRELYARALRPGPYGGGDLDSTRPAAAEVAAELERIAGDARAGQARPRGALLAGRFEVQALLGAGTSARTFLVCDRETGLVLAAKQYFQPGALAADSEAAREFNLLWHHPHPNLPRPFNIFRTGTDVQMVMEWIDGPSLRSLLPTLHHDRAQWLRLAHDLLAAATHLEGLSILHRDIKPENVVVRGGDGRAFLIDYGRAAPAADPGAPTGSPRYLPPEWFASSTQPATSDRYALAVTLYEALTGTLPFRDEGAAFSHEPRLAPPDDLPRDLWALATVLLRAIAIEPAARYPTMVALRDAIEQAANWNTTDDDAIERPPLINPWVNQVRGLFRNSSGGNADNRGLDSPFARDTYVETALDTDLWPRIREYRPAAVFLSGNPGDGKTAFLERVRDHLTSAGAELAPGDNPSGWEAVLDGHVYRACFDASEAAGARSADEQLADRLDGLGDDRPQSDLTVLVAINDGRLGEVRERFANDFPWLIDALADADQAPAAAGNGGAPPVWLIDLKQRSYVALRPDPTAPSVMRRMLRILVEERRWETCPGCRAEPTCPILGNARALARDDEDGVAGRLERLLLLAHLRGERHTTVRDLRSGLALLITADLGCENVHNGAAALGDGADAWNPFFWTTAFTTSTERDLVLGELRWLDPARFAQPALERFFAFRQRPEDAGERSRLFADGSDLPPGAGDGWLHAVKRRLVFEGRRPAEADGGEPNATGQRFRPDRLLPYRAAERMIAVLVGEADPATLLADVLRGIGRSDDLAEAMRADGLSLRVITSPEHRLEIVKRFPTEEFVLEVERQAGARLVETTPRALVLRHRPTKTPVRLTLDLVETLVRLANGLDPASQELQPLLEELGPFKSRVQLSTSPELLLIEGGHRRHRLRRGEHDRIVREDVGVPFDGAKAAIRGEGAR